jgi:hypothetical protein
MDQKIVEPISSPKISRGKKGKSDTGIAEVDARNRLAGLEES